MTAKIIWTLIFFCSIRGVYANAAKKEIAYTLAFTVTLFFSMYICLLYTSDAADEL